MHWRASYIIGAFDARVGDIGDVDSRGLVGAGLAAAVVLVDHYRVPHRVHGHVAVPHLGHRAVSALPRLDPQPVVRVLDHRIPHRDV